jgi:hypothetical protein
MTDELTGFFTLLRPNLRESSANTYVGTLKRIMTLLKTEDISTIVKKYKELIKEIGDKSAKVQMNILQVILLFLNPENNIPDTTNKYIKQLANIPDKKKVYDEITEIFNGLKAEYQTEQEEQTMNTKQQENHIDYAELQKAYTKLYDQVKYIEKLDPKTVANDLVYEYQKYVILSFYLAKEPTRGEIGDAYFIKTKRDYKFLEELKKKNTRINYIDFPAGKLVLGDFKNVATAGPKELTLEKPIMAVLKKWKRLNKTRYLITKKDGEPIGHKYMYNVLTNIFQDLLGEKGENKKISVNVLRHTYISEELKGDTMLKKKKKMAENMLHSVSTQEKIYRKKI